uniref:Protein FLX-like 3 n=1 Tax=Leersia perrieri TaxID=77586 RepID=A0A0D9XXM8_9ORYZ
MSGRDRLPRRFIEDARGYPDVRVADERRGYPAVRVVEDRRGYPGIRVIEDRRGYPEIHEGPVMRIAPRHHTTILEEEFEIQEAELRRLMADHRALADERLALHRELQAGKDEIRHLNMIIADISAKKESYISELVDKRRKLEAELRANESLRDEIVQLQGEIDKHIVVRKELSAKAASITHELTREKSNKQQIPMLKVEIDALRQDLVHTRSACELEQKGNFELVEQKKAMEKSMISMAQEIEQMRAELANFEGRQWAPGVSYGMKLGSPEVTFPTPYGDNYNIHVGTSEKGHSHLPESSSWGAYDNNRFQYRQQRQPAAAPAKESWPELVGVSSEAAKAKIGEERPEVDVQVDAADAFVTMDFNAARGGSSLTPMTRSLELPGSANYAQEIQT